MQANLPLQRYTVGSAQARVGERASNDRDNGMSNGKGQRANIIVEIYLAKQQAKVA